MCAQNVENHSFFHNAVVFTNILIKRNRDICFDLPPKPHNRKDNKSNSWFYIVIINKRSYSVLFITVTYSFVFKSKVQNFSIISLVQLAICLFDKYHVLLQSVKYD